MCRDGNLWYYDEGIASTAANLRRAGHELRFRMVGDQDDFATVRAWVESERGPRTILVFMTSLAFSAYGHDMPGTLPIVNGMKESTGLMTGFLGLHATMNTDEVLAHPDIDFVGRGEMDEAMVEFCDALDAGRSLRNIQNFWVKEDGRIWRNELRPAVHDLSDLPHPARDLLPPEAMANERDGILTVVAMRGCPMECSFCANPVVKRLYEGKGKWTRIKPVDYLLNEIRAALDANPNICAVFFHDDIFAPSKAWAAEFFDRYPQEIDLPYGCNLVIDQVTPEFVDGLRRSGCCQVQIGVESGSEFIRNEVLKKEASEEQIETALARFREAHIFVKLFAMMGLPEETRYRYRESVRNFGRYRPDMVQIQVWEAHEGSDLLTDDRDAGELANRHHHPGRDRRAWRIKFYYRYYQRFVALYEALHDMRHERPVRAWFLSRLVDAAILFRWTPEVLLARDWDGRRRWPAWWIENRWLVRLGRRLLGPFWDDVVARDVRLASIYIWHPKFGPRSDGEGWLEGSRVDMRGRRQVPA